MGGLVRRRRVQVLSLVVFAGLALAVGLLHRSSGGDGGGPRRPPLLSGKPTSGLVVSLEPARSSKAMVRVVPTSEFAAITVQVSAEGDVAVKDPSPVSIPAPAVDQEVTRFAGYSLKGLAPGTLRLQVVGLDAEGRPVATAADELFVQRVGRRQVQSTSGPLDLELKALRAAGRSPAEVEDARGDGAVTVTAGTPGETMRSSASATTASLGGVVTVQGQIRYDDRNGNPHPVRFAPVEIHDSTGPGTSVLVTTVNTDAAGNYGTTVSNVHPGGGNRNIFIRVLARSTGFRIVAGGNVHRIDSAVTNNVADGTTLTVNLRANNTADNNTAFSVHDALVSQVQYVTGLLGAPLADIDVDFPTGHSTSNFSGGALHILRLDRFDWDVNNHEYGHYFMSAQNIENNPGGPHSGGSNLSEDPGRNKDSGTRLAWGEGYPTYHGTTLQEAMGTAAFGIPNVGDTFYTDTEDISLNYDLEGPAGGTGLGEDNELSVQRILWDLRDTPGPGDAGDDRGVALGDPAIFTTLRAAAVRTLSDANTALTAGRTAKQVVDMGCVLTQQAVAPRITSPASNSVAVATVPPTITWDPQGGGPAHRNNRFVVEFYDSSFALVFASPEQTAISYTPSAADWATVVGSGASRRTAINVAVRGRQTDAPATGPYTGCNIGLQVRSQPVLTTLATSAPTLAATSLTASVSDTATLSNGFNPTGTIEFRLFGRNDLTCAAAPVFVTSRAVSGNGAYTSDPFTTGLGEYRWVVTYDGDANNLPATSPCNAPNETSEVAPVCSAPPPPGTLPGNTILIAAPGLITIGTPGDDVIYGTAGFDRIDGRSGNDIVFGQAGIDEITGGDGLDTVCGGGGNDRLFGAAGNDLIAGDLGFDDLAGGDGDDLLLGGLDTDRLTGGNGTDGCGFAPDTMLFCEGSP